MVVKKTDKEVQVFIPFREDCVTMYQAPTFRVGHEAQLSISQWFDSVQVLTGYKSCIIRLTWQFFKFSLVTCLS